MIEIAFEKFHDHVFVERGYDLYVMKNGLGDPLYVGISTRSIWERWFGWNGHMVWDGNTIYGISAVGQKIEDHLPDSLKWKIQLWTLKDCIKFCKQELTERKHLPDIKFIEPLMIQKLSPILNGSYNLKPGKDTTQKSKKEIEREEYLDQMYRALFDKKR
jgi:hypothetical protein